MNNPSLSAIKDDKEVINLIKGIVGEKGFKIVNLLFSIDKADEFEIAEKLNEDVNYVRSVMYKMYTHNLVNYTRRRDQVKGWYIYTWELSPQKIYSVVLERKEKKLDELFKKVEEEKNKEQEFLCENCKIRFSFEKALNLNFTCFACGGMLTPLNNEEIVLQLNNEIKQLSNSIGLIRRRINEL